jgi:hypothetical protein
MDDGVGTRSESDEVEGRLAESVGAPTSHPHQPLELDGIDPPARDLATALLK